MNCKADLASRKHLQHGSPLTAAALQDHLSRQYSLNDRVTSNKKKRAHPTKPVVKATVIGTSCTKCGSKGAPNGEYTLDVSPPPLTLAQRLGLVDAPTQLLSKDEWSSVKACSNKREDSRLPCPICQEEFGLNQQALLSCSHVFHLACLKSFEKFSRSKRCPLCREENYQTRVILDGAKHWRERAATIIQSAWRGYKVRQWYAKHCETTPPTHPSLRRKHFEKKLTRLTERMVGSCDARSDSVDSVLVESENALENARNVMRAFDLCTQQPSSWNTIREKAKSHISADCAVCLTPLHPLTHSQPHNATPTFTRPLSVLSCSHVLHTSCIKSLEDYSPVGSVYLCPLCRTPYQRNTFEIS